MNLYEDESLSRTAIARAEAMAELRSKRRLRRLHQFAVQMHKERIAAAHETPEMEEIYQTLCQEKLRKPRLG